MFVKIKKEKLIVAISLSIYLSFYAALGLSKQVFQSSDQSFLSYFNMIRFAVPFAISLAMLIFTIFIFEKEKIFLNLSFLFFFFMIIAFTTGERDISFDQIYLVVLSIGCLSFFYILNYLQIPSIKNKILILTILATGISSVFLISSAFKEFDLFSQNYYQLSTAHSTFLNNYFPRVTGLARSLAILSLFLIVLHSFQNNHKKLILITILILNFFIWKLQSRGAIICYLASFIFFFLFLKNNGSINFLKKTFLFLIVPVLTAQIFFTPQNSIKISNFFCNKNFVLNCDGNEKELKSKELKSKEFNSRFVELLPLVNDKTGSGRTLLWSQALGKFNNKFFGYGIQADRYLLNEEQNGTYGNNVSNGYIYALISGGYGSFIILFFFVIFFYFKIFNLFVLNKAYKTPGNIYYAVSVILILFFTLRIFVENSFAVFGTDLLVILPCAIIFLEKNFRYES